MEPGNEHRAGLAGRGSSLRADALTVHRQSGIRADDSPGPRIRRRQTKTSNSPAPNCRSRSRCHMSAIARYSPKAEDASGEARCPSRRGTKPQHRPSSRPALRRGTESFSRPLAIRTGDPVDRKPLTRAAESDTAPIPSLRVCRTVSLASSRAAASFGAMPHHQKIP